MNATTRWNAILVLILAMGAASGEEVIHDFRGAKFNPKLVGRTGTDSEKWVKLDESGLQILFTPDSAPQHPVGIFWRPKPEGDFVTTIRYEILKTDRPTRAYGVGLELYLMLENETRDGIVWARLMRPKTGPTLSFSHMTYDDAGKRISKNSRMIAASPETERGRLRLERQGTVAIASYAEGEEEDFKEFQRTEIGDVVIRMVRVAGLAGGDPNANLDLRVLEWRMQTKPIPAQANLETSDNTYSEAHKRVRWLLWGGIASVIVVAAILVAVTRRSKPSLELVAKSPEKLPVRPGQTTSKQKNAPRDKPKPRDL